MESNPKYFVITLATIYSSTVEPTLGVLLVVLSLQLATIMMLQLMSMVRKELKKTPFMNVWCLINKNVSFNYNTSIFHSQA